MCVVTSNNGWKVEIVPLYIFKLVDDCSNLYDLFDFSNILNEDKTLHVMKKISLKML